MEHWQIEDSLDLLGNCLSRAVALIPKGKEAPDPESLTPILESIRQELEEGLMGLNMLEGLLEV